MTAGAPTKYKPEYAEQARKACLLFGAVDEELAKFFGVCIATIHNWKNDYPEFLDAIKSGKDIADANVAERLYQRAMGYTCKETKIATHEGRITDSQDIDKHYPPEPVACFFWLKNRRPKEWRDKQEVDHSSTDGSMRPQIVMIPRNGREKEEDDASNID